VLSGIEPLELGAGDRARRSGGAAAIPGVGKKTSERIVLELRIGCRACGRPRPPSAASRQLSALRVDLLSALMNPRVSSASRRESRGLGAEGWQADAGFERTLKQACELAK
jgi:hypothetical protein